MFFKRFRSHPSGSDSPPGNQLGNHPITDAEYVAAYQATGELRLLGELYARYMDLVYAICFKYLRDEEAAKDAVMQLFEQLVTDLKRHEVQHFRNWLHTVARNYCLMQLRRQSLTVGFADADDPDDAHLSRHLPAEPADDDLDADIEQLTRSLALLPTEQRTCIELFYLQQKSYAEVSALTGYDLKQVKSYLQNGRRNLKLMLTPLSHR